MPPLPDALTAPAAPARGRLAVRALGRFSAGLLLLAGPLFLAAGTLRFWQAWVYLAVLSGSMLGAFAVLLVRDPGLLERRLHGREPERGQRWIVALGSACGFFVFLVPGLDRRWGWSLVPPGLVLGADLLVLLGYALFLRVLQENRFASRVIEVVAGQRVIQTGPYARVRHPLYVAVLVLFLATPVALGSWWGLLPAALQVPILVARIQREERSLCATLPGYTDYRLRTRHRLLPGVW